MHSAPEKAWGQLVMVVYGLGSADRNLIQYCDHMRRTARVLNTQDDRPYVGWWGCTRGLTS